MILENFNAPEDNDPKDPTNDNSGAPRMNAEDDTEMEDEEDDDEDDSDDDDSDDDGDYEILPSNDSGISNDDNAATGKMHEKEGE